MSDVTGHTHLEWKRLVRRFRTPLRTAAGEFATRESIVVRLSDAGRLGYGEVAPWPGFPVETLDEAARILNGARSETVSATPCLDAALSHARAWIAEGWGAREVALPCAGLAGAPSHAEEKFRAGFPSVKLKLGGNPLWWPSPEFPYDLSKIWELVERHPGAVRLDANGSLSSEDFLEWGMWFACRELEWIEQPLPPGLESVMLAVADLRGLEPERLALDESVAGTRPFDPGFPGVFVVKPLLAGDLAGFRARRATVAPGRLSYSSVFETPFGRQAALCIAGEDTASKHAVGFDTLGRFDDDLDAHEPGPVARTVVRDAAFWEDLWKRL